MFNPCSWVLDRYLASVIELQHLLCTLNNRDTHLCRVGVCTQHGPGRHLYLADKWWPHPAICSHWDWSGGGRWVYMLTVVSNLKVIVQTCFNCLCGRRNDGEVLTEGEHRLTGHWTVPPPALKITALRISTKEMGGLHLNRSLSVRETEYGSIFAVFVF